MKTTTKRVAKERQTEDGLTLVTDVDKLIKGVKETATGAAAHFRALLEKKGVKLSKDEDDELDKKVGVKDGGPLDKVLDDATGVDEDDAGGDETRERREEDAEEDDAEEADVDAMDEKTAKAEAKRERSKRKEAEKQRDRALQLAEKASTRIKSAERMQLTESVLSDMEIPDEFRPRIKDEIAMRGLSTEAQIREHVKNFDLSFIRPMKESAGVPGFAFSGANNGAAPALKFKEPEA